LSRWQGGLKAIAYLNEALKITGKGILMTSSQKTARRLRWFIFVVGVVFSLAGVAYVFMPYLNDSTGWGLMGFMGSVMIYNPFGGDSELFYGINSVFVIGLVILAQWLFLRPYRNWTPDTTKVAKPLAPSIIVAAAMSALLSTGFIALLMELPNWWEPVMDPEHHGQLCIWAGMLILWGVWAAIFFAYFKQGDHYTKFGKVIRGLVAGSFLEIVIAIPVHIWAARQRECYCCRGTYTTLIVAGTVLFWAFGPGIIILFMREKHRRESLLTPSSESDEADSSSSVQEV